MVSSAPPAEEVPLYPHIEPSNEHTSLAASGKVSYYTSSSPSTYVVHEENNSIDGNSSNCCVNLIIRLCLSCSISVTCLVTIFSLAVFIFAAVTMANPPTYFADYKYPPSINYGETASFTIDIYDEDDDENLMFDISEVIYNSNTTTTTTSNTTSSCQNVFNICYRITSIPNYPILNQPEISSRMQVGIIPGGDDDDIDDEGDAHQFWHSEFWQGIPINECQDVGDLSTYSSVSVCNDNSKIWVNTRAYQPDTEVIFYYNYGCSDTATCDNYYGFRSLLAGTMTVSGIIFIATILCACCFCCCLCCSCFR